MGAGDDLLDFGADNLPANVALGLGSFRFDGQDGLDHFNVNNRMDIGRWTYSRGTGQLRCDRTTVPYTAVLNDANVEEMTVNAGPAGDTFQAGTGFASGVAAGTHTTFVGAGGLDIFQPGQISFGLTNQSLITGKSPSTPAASRPTARGAAATWYSASAQSTPITAHLDATTLDDLPAIISLDREDRLSSSCQLDQSHVSGTGTDTIYAKPNTLAELLSINGNSPTSARAIH